MGRPNILVIVQLCLATVSAFSLLDFTFDSSLNPLKGANVDPSGVSGPSADLPQNVWDMVPVIGERISHLINRLRSFAERPSTSDCFKRSASALKAKCGGELESDEGERVRMAISMTLCELETAAHAAIPLECLDFSHGANIRTSENQSATQAVCVAALSRSPQHWSSYSGYLRDVPQLCFAFRRLNDIDTAHLIQRNTSIEALNLLILLRGREETESKRQQQVKSTMDAMEIMQRALQSSVDRVREAPQEALVEAGGMISQLFGQYSVRLDELHNALVLQLQQSHKLVIGELHQAMMSTVEKHSETIAIALKTAEDHSRNSHRLLQHQHELASIALDVLNARWQDLTLHIVTIHESTKAALASALHASSELDLQFQKLTRHQEVIEKASSSLDTLSASLEHLTTLAEDRLISINNTAWAVQNSLSESGTPGRLFRASADVLWRAYLKLNHLGIRSIPVSVDIVFYMVPACWYVLQGTRIFGGIVIVIARKTGVCLATGLSLTQTILLELLSLVMKMLGGRRVTGGQKAGTRYHYTDSSSLKQPTVKVTPVHAEGLDGQPHRASSGPRVPPEHVASTFADRPTTKTIDSISSSPLKSP
ncbi:hypothetical protein M407DRAFT_22996 [Tulasnella calospora MUT 4182]|uniref:Nuclear fusion protein KAR5 n=1 Tax=Tulasnella calospora MUT 4182 TaxID=1051891 RepID=A0A0C3QM41_9AGAM|nr:hypothetical protein M407DRAFT_22996 [Tulasnella calospora MUT 4182]